MKSSVRFAKKHTILSNKFHAQIKKDLPEIKYLTKQQVSAIIKESNKCIADHVITQPLGFKLPLQLGYLCVSKYMPKPYKVIVDWGSSKKFKKEIPFTNLHTFGYVYQIRWFKNPKNSTFNLYRHMAKRCVKRELAKNIRAGTDFLALDRSYFEKKFNINNIYNIN